MTKSELRKIYLTRQRSLGNLERTEKSTRIKERFFENVDLKDVKVMHLFLSIAEKNEIESSLIFNDLWKEHELVKTVAPRVDFENDTLEHLKYDSHSTLDKNHWGIPEPVGCRTD